MLSLGPDHGAGVTPDAEPLVLLPGTLCDRRLWEPVISRLPPRLIIVRLLIGETSTPAMAARLLHELPPRFALAGFSLGGIVALEMAAQAPGRISRLALLDTNARPDPEAHHAARRAAVAEAMAMGLEAYAAERLLPAYFTGERPACAEAIRAMAVEAGLDAFRAQSEIAIRRLDSRPRLGAIAVPTLVLCGEADRLCPVDRHREMAEGLPQAQLVIIPGAGHFAPLEAPDAVSDAMRAWLAEQAAIPPSDTIGKA